jgi:ketosteroid isomerase-like protein
VEWQVIDTLGLWHQIVESRDTSQLEAILADDAVLISPVVHTHQKGKAITQLYS